MESRMWRVAAAVAALVLPGAATFAGTPGPISGFWSIQAENDLWGSRDDRFYTHGTKLSYASPEPPPQFLENLAGALPFYRPGDESLFGWSLGQKIFTPEDTETPTLNADDRPYAGWLYTNLGIAHRFDTTGRRTGINGLVFTLGIVGPASLAAETQKEFHRLIDTDIPQGWDNQLENEPGIGITYLRKYRWIYELGGRQQLELSRHTGASLGNVYTYASAGAMIRLGSRLENDIGPPSIAPGFPGVPAFRPSPTLNWYLFAGLEGRLMARDIFLDGNSYTDSHHVDKYPLVGDLQFGIAFHYRGMRIALSNMLRSKEFAGQDEPTQYGAVNVTVYVR